MKFGVVITTYNSPAWLEKVLWGYENQTDTDFEVIIADDGSSSDTKTVVDDFMSRGKLNILHVWHEDDGFRKTVILNKAIMTTESDYLMFTDGDCIPRKDLIEVHKKNAREGYYCSAGYFKMCMQASEKATEQDIRLGKVFSYTWLIQQGQLKTFKFLKLLARGRFAQLLNILTPAKATWNGANSSAYKADILSVNGFDERLQYGGLDRELGERLINKGIKGVQIRYSAICVHLDHKRGYESSEVWSKNRAIRKSVVEDKLDWTEHGISKAVKL